MEPAADQFVCPHCGQQMLVPQDDDGVPLRTVLCPGCQQPLTVQRESLEPSPDELDLNRIQRHASLRRSVYRSRSHALIAVITCAVLAIELTRQSILAVRDRRFFWLALYLLSDGIALACAMYAYRRARALTEQCRTASRDALQFEPDFSTLGDGSDRWQNLHDVR